jgi:hypothetical protein
MSVTVLVTYAEPLRYLVSAVFMLSQTTAAEPAVSLTNTDEVQYVYSILISLVKACFPSIRFIVFRAVSIKLSSQRVIKIGRALSTFWKNLMFSSSG